MTNAIVGYTGFVGMNLLQFYNFDNYYNSKNFHTARGKVFDTLFFSAIPAVKWYANKNPQKDIDNIEEIKHVLKDIIVKKFILISTIDVYDTVDKQYDEDYLIGDSNHTYGKNRYMFECFIKETFNDYNIVRLPALFGKGLKKNLIYDLINNNKVNNIPLNSSFQWYFLDWLKKDLDIILKHDIKICNLFTEPIHTRKIVKIFKEVYDIDYRLESEDNSFTLNYDVCTKYKRYFNCNKDYIAEENEVIQSLKDYLLFEKMDKSKLCVSNICVNNISQLHFSCILKLYGIKNIQIAPTKLIKSWKDIDEIDLSVFSGLNIYSFQSITYTLNDLNIFDENTRSKLYDHIVKIIDISEKNNLSILVFGCPMNRKILDDKINNKQIFIDFFKRLGDYLEGKDIKICLENNSKDYKCNFMNTIKECSDIIREINKNNIKMMVDLGNAVMENDEWYYLRNHMDIICNIDISNPYMKDFSNIHESNEIFNHVLKVNEYNGIINLEMLIDSQKDEIEILMKSLNNFVRLYGL